MTKPNEYLKIEKNAIAEARKAMVKHNWATLPSSNILCKYGCNSLSHAINKYHAGFLNFRTALGQKNTKKPNGYWKSLDNTLAEARKAMQEQEWNTLPSHGELTKHGYSALQTAINQYQGGIQNFRTLLGQQNPNTKPPGYWKSLDNTLAEALKAMQEQKWTTLPSHGDLKKHGYNSLNAAISIYHGGMSNFRTTLGQTNTKKPYRYWQNIDNTIKEAQQAMTDNKWDTLPAQKEIVKHGYSSLINAISRYHCGLRNFRTTLGQQTLQKPKDFWKNLDNTLAEARKAMQEQEWNTLPSHGQLIKHGYNSLSRAIVCHGGYIEFRTLLTEHETGKTQKEQLEELLDEYIAA